MVVLVGWPTGAKVGYPFHRGKAQTGQHWGHPLVRVLLPVGK